MEAQDQMESHPKKEKLVAKESRGQEDHQARLERTPNIVPVPNEREAYQRTRPKPRSKIDEMIKLSFSFLGFFEINFLFLIAYHSKFIFSRLQMINKNFQSNVQQLQNL